MCIGVPGRVVGLSGEQPGIALVDVSGATRPINVGLLDGEPVAPGDWIVIHMGFALERMSDAQAADALRVLDDLGQGTGVDEAAFDADDDPPPSWND